MRLAVSHVEAGFAGDGYSKNIMMALPRSLLRRPLIEHTLLIHHTDILDNRRDLFAGESDLYLDEVCTWLAFEYDIIISPSNTCILSQS